MKVDLRVITMDVLAGGDARQRHGESQRRRIFPVVTPEDRYQSARLHTSDVAAGSNEHAERSGSGPDELLSQRDTRNLKMQKIIDEGTSPWGIKVTLVEIKDVELPETMQRAMAAQAEAERDRRAKIVHADGEFQASERLSKAAHVLDAEPQALQLRYLQTLTQISTDRTTVVVFPLPIDLIKPFLQSKAESGKKE